MKWALVQNPWWRTQYIEISGNVFRNVAVMMSLEGEEPAGLPTNGYLRDLVFRNNLQLIDSPQATFGVFLNPSLVTLNRGGNRMTIEHNTSYISPDANAAAQTLNSINRLDTTSPFTINNLALRSNFGSHTTYGGPSGAQLNSLADTNLRYTNNSFVGTDRAGAGANQSQVTANCSGGRACGNQYWGSDGNINVDYRFLDPAANDFRIGSNIHTITGATNASPIVFTTADAHGLLVGQTVRVQNVGGNTAANGADWAVVTVPTPTTFTLKDGVDNPANGSGVYTSGGTVTNGSWTGAHDATDVGADTTQLALIRGLSVAPTAISATFRWFLPSALASQVCQVEVSPDSGVVDDSADYTVVNSINPAFYIRYDQDNVNPLASVDSSGTVRTFQVGTSGSSTGDDGNVHALSLTSATVYYYRLFCGGAMERGSFTTE